MVLSALIQSIGQGRCCGFIYDPAYIQAGNFTGFLSSLALRVVEIGRHGDHSLGHFLSEVILGRFLHFLQHHGADLLRSILPAIYVNPNRIIVTFNHFIAPVADLFGHFVKTATHKTLYAADGILRIGDRLALGRVSHFTFSILQESHYRRGCTATFLIRYHHRFITFHHRNTTICCTEINSYNLSHCKIYLVHTCFSMIMPNEPGVKKWQ